jgi:hypothetical protein
VKFHKAIGSNGDIGIWHETFLVKASAHIDAVGRAGTALGRLGRTDGSDAPVSGDATQHGA